MEVLGNSDKSKLDQTGPRSWQDKAYLENKNPQTRDTVLKISIFENGLAFLKKLKNKTSKKSTHYSRLFPPRS